MRQDKHSRRKSALKEILEGIGLMLLGVVCWLLSRDFTFVEGVSTRYETRSNINLIILAPVLLIIGAVVLVMGLVHLIRSGGDSDGEQ